MNEAAKIVPQFSEEVTKKDLARFHSKYRKDGPVPDPALYGDIGACWPWIGTMNNDGYGIFKWKGKNRRAHQFSWRVHRGEIPDRLWTLHRCDNPTCVNIDHLWIGTSAENTADRHAKGRTASGERSGATLHPERMARGEKNGCAILTEDLVREIRRLVGTGLTRKEVGERLGINAPTVYAVAARRLWRHVL